MRQSQKFPIFTVTFKKLSISFGLTVLLMVIITGGAGCKKRTTIEVPKGILQAKSATLDELIHIVNQLDEIQAAKASNIKAEYTSEKMEGSLIELEKYPRAPGFILLKRPDSTYLRILNPAFRKSEISLVSEGDEFRVWLHSRREFYIGKNSSRELISDELEEDPKIPIRAYHIFDAVFPKAIPLNDLVRGYAKTEEEDAHVKYYVLRVSRVDSFPRIRPLREFWIERVGMTISRQRIFDEDGRIVGDITYSDAVRIDKYTLPRKINIKRPLDGYTLELEFKDWQVNPSFREDAFRLEEPVELEGVRVIRFK